MMAQVLSAIPLHGLDAVLMAAECALESGRPSDEHVLNVLGRLKGPLRQDDIIATLHLKVNILTSWRDRLHQGSEKNVLYAVT